MIRSYKKKNKDDEISKLARWKREGVYEVLMNVFMICEKKKYVCVLFIYRIYDP